MSVHLPDEIISEILSPALKVPDHEFSDTSSNSPFAGRYCESSSAFLVVCKAWLRVATPLLYHVVVLRSKAQAAALDSALRKNPDLPRFIKKLRIEGGFGAAMLKIIKMATNVTDLFISVNIWSSDNVSGLVRGLPLMDPTRVIMFDTPYHGTRNKNSQSLMDALKKCIEEEWKHLTVFELPFYSHYYSTSTLTTVSTSLARASALKTVVIPAMRIYGQHPPEYLSTIAKNPSVQSIEFRQPTHPGRFGAQQLDPLPPALAHPSLRGLVKVPESSTPDITRPSSPAPSSNSQLQYSTEAVPDEIWTLILRFAMTRDVEVRSSIGRSRRFWLVSKKFARLALPFLRESLLFTSASKYDGFLSQLSDDPSLLSQVRTLYFHTSFASNLRPIIKIPLENIICLVPVSVTLKVFSDLAKHCGATLLRLEGLHIAKSSGVAQPAIFSHLKKIKSLSLGIKTPFASSNSVPSTALATLEELSLSPYDSSILPILLQMDMPALKVVNFPSGNGALAPFLRKHGHKLRTLTVSVTTPLVVNLFETCPDLVDLTVVCGSGVPDASGFTCNAVSTPAIETIQFQTDGRFRGAERKWASFFDHLVVDTLPNLRQISLPCIRWPTTEHDIGKSHWAKWAERLLDSNVKLVDSQGVGWRRRLKR
ncbi:F-box domain-containing protein [Favolaschia claudopus]|uniref:F-box domain-containing protein n=1 Tax=Favolaschia claudopus TaxID=2862362 RepID=A0AAW0D941_9AGAR